jgi:hypothetical protein
MADVLGGERALATEMDNGCHDGTLQKGRARRHMKKSLVVLAALVVWAMAGVATAATRSTKSTNSEKQVSFGLEADYAEDTDFGVGARAIFNLDKVLPGLEGVGSFNYFFPSSGEDIPGVDVDFKFWEINANAIYKFKVGEGSVRPYFGGGLVIAHVKGGAGVDLGDLGSIDVSASETKLGINVLGGVLFGGPSPKFFVEGKIEDHDGSQFVVSAGVRF